MGKKDATSTQTTRPDAATAQWQELLRQIQAAALGGLGFGGLGGAAGGVTAPNQGNVYGTAQDALKANFDRQRLLAGRTANDYATQAGAFGGDRAALLRAAGLGDVNRQESEVLANLGITQQNEQWNRIMQLLGLGTFGGGSTTSMTQPGSGLGGLLGAGMTVGSQFLPGGLFNRGKRGKK